MNTLLPLAAIVLLYLLGDWLIWRARRQRQLHGLADASTLDLDGKTLYSARLKLSGRPDRIVEEHGIPIPEEWKSSPRVYDSHRAQLAVYFLLIEEITAIRPTHGYIVTGDDARHRIENTPELREWVLGIAERIRLMRREAERPIAVNPPAAKCRACGMRHHCGQARG